MTTSPLDREQRLEQALEDLGLAAAQLARLRNGAWCWCGPSFAGRHFYQCIEMTAAMKQARDAKTEGLLAASGAGGEE